MESQKTEILVQKYLEGETSLEEEKQLRAYFNSENVAPHLEEYQTLFGFFKAEQAETYQPPQQTKSKKNIYTWIGGAAASIAIIMGVFMFGPTPEKQSGIIKDPEIALQKTKEALRLIAQQMHNGKEELVYLTEIDNTRDKLIKENLKLKQ